MTRNGSILVVNSGSSSIKLALFAMAEAEPSRLCTGTVERIGLDRGRVIVSDNEGAVITMKVGATSGLLHVLGGDHAACD
jgi:acetate kinase